MVSNTVSSGTVSVGGIGTGTFRGTANNFRAFGNNVQFASTLKWGQRSVALLLVL